MSKKLFSFLFSQIFCLSLIANEDQEYNWRNRFQTPEYVEYYSTHSDHQKGWGIDLLSHHSLEEKFNILDIGCGDGKHSIYLAEIFPRSKIIGLDVSKSMIDFNKKKYPQTLYPNLEFVEGNATSMPFNEEEFDLVFSCACLHLIKNEKQKLALKCIQKSLKHDGIFLAVFPLHDKNPFADMITSLMKNSKWSFYFQDFLKESPPNFSESEYKKLLNEVGLIPLEVKRLPTTRIFRNDKEFISWFSKEPPYIFRVPKEYREEFAQVVLKNFLTINPPDREGKIYNPYWILEVKAIKKEM